MPRVDQGLENSDETANVGPVEPGGRLVDQDDGVVGWLLPVVRRSMVATLAGDGDLTEVADKFEALGFAAGKRI